jgi:hypothetical protein
MSDIYDTMPLTQIAPAYEVWGMSGSAEHSDFGGSGHFIGDASDLGRASDLVHENQQGGAAAWILDKESREVVKALPPAPAATGPVIGVS